MEYAPDDIIYGYDTGDAIKKQSIKLLTLIQDNIKLVRISILFFFFFFCSGFVRQFIMTLLNRACAAIL